MALVYYINMEHATSRVKQLKLPLYLVEKPFDTRQLLAGTFDFVTCQRGDGSFYGNGGASCKKGSPAELPTKLEGKVSSKTQALCEKHSKRVVAITGKTPTAAAADLEAFKEAKADALQRIKEGKLTKQDIESLVLHHEEYVAKDAEFLIVGQEPKAPKQTAEVQAEFLAAKVAQSDLERSGWDQSRATATRRADDVLGQSEAGQSIPGNSFRAVTVNAGRDLAGLDGLSNRQQNELFAGYYGNKTLASIEMSNVPAKTVGDGNRGKDGAINPDKSAYGLLSKSRNEIRAEYAERRAAIVKDTIQDAVTNGKTQHVMAAPGAGAKYTTFQTEVVDKFWNGKSGAESNIREVSVPLTTTGKSAATKNIKGHVIDLGNGKTMTSHAATFVTQGYQSGPKMAELRRKSIEAAKTAPGYSPAKKTASSSPPPRQRTTGTRAEKPKTQERKNTMSSWSKGRLERARQKAYDQGDDAKIAQINAILGGMS